VVLRLCVDLLNAGGGIVADDDAAGERSSRTCEPA
jgi:hypothetical protein